MVARDIVDRWREFARSAGEALQTVSPSAWLRPSGYEGWSAHDLLAHVSSTQQATPRILESAFGGSGAASSEPFDQDRWNGAMVRRRRDQPEKDLIEELRRGVSDLTRALEERVVVTADLARVVPAGAGRGRPLKEVFDELLDHQRGHLSDLLKAVAI
jgi:uncharacterized protein (TIGR03083 family)